LEFHAVAVQYPPHYSAEATANNNNNNKGKVKGPPPPPPPPVRITVATASLSGSQWQEYVHHPLILQSESQIILNAESFRTDRLPLLTSRLVEMDASTSNGAIEFAAVFCRALTRNRPNRAMGLQGTRELSIEEPLKVHEERETLEFCLEVAAGDASPLTTHSQTASPVPADAAGDVSTSSLSHAVALKILWNGVEISRFFGDVRGKGKIHWATSGGAPHHSTKLRFRVPVPGDFVVADCQLRGVLLFQAAEVDEFAVTGDLLTRLRLGSQREEELAWTVLGRKARTRCRIGFLVFPSAESFLKDQFRKISQQRRERLDGPRWVHISTPYGEEEPLPWRAVFIDEHGVSNLEEVASSSSSSSSKTAPKLKLMNITKLVCWEAAPTQPRVEARRHRHRLLLNKDEDKAQKKNQVELAGVDFTATARKKGDEFRAFWRGRVMPLNFIGNSRTVMRAVLQTRASRLVRTKNLSELKVLAEVHHLVDVGDEEEQVIEKLPICVKELCSLGPGVITVQYRIEVSANNGVVLGYERRLRIDVDNA
jgi:hypothetical protein